MAKQCKVCGALLLTAIVATSNIFPYVCETCKAPNEPDMEKQEMSTSYKFPAMIVSRYVTGVVKKFKKHVKERPKRKVVEKIPNI
ncbi:MAG TPA: hypothetical protein VGO63_00050 [Candidatus Paceibacterota bacterium]|jgi:protein-arginine kinase activator protein McsA|nr:hypothetical protein [Candidatus Paceibacterota bacterium]